MEETNDTALVSYIDGRLSSVTLTIVLWASLTPPVKSLKNDLEQIPDMGPCLYAISLGIRLHLQEDSHADQLRATLMRFNTPMRSTSHTFASCFRNGIRFYEHEEAKANGQGCITERMIRRLLAPDFQARAIGFAREGMGAAAIAAKMIREEVLPQLPRVKKDLEVGLCCAGCFKKGAREVLGASLLRNAI